jgi:hypothetical protein
MTPLHYATWQGCLGVVQALLTLLHCSDIDVNHWNAQGWTALTNAIDTDSIDIARMLLMREDIEIYPACILAEAREDSLPRDLLLKLGVWPSSELLLSDLEIALFLENTY